MPKCIERLKNKAKESPCWDLFSLSAEFYQMFPVFCTHTSKWTCCIFGTLPLAVQSSVPAAFLMVLNTTLGNTEQPPTGSRGGNGLWTGGSHPLCSDSNTDPETHKWSYQGLKSNSIPTTFVLLTGNDALIMGFWFTFLPALGPHMLLAYRSQ